MSLHKVIELIFTLIMLLFLATLVIGVLLGITLIQELSGYDLSFKIRAFFIAGMFALFIYLMKLIVDKIRNFYRYI